MMWIVTHLVALWIGGAIGFFVAALCAAAKKGDQSEYKPNKTHGAHDK